MRRLLLALAAALMASTLAAQPATVALDSGTWRPIVDLSILSYDEGPEDGEGTVSPFRYGGVGALYGWQGSIEIGGALMLGAPEVQTEGDPPARETQLLVFAPVRLLEMIDVGPTFEVWNMDRGWADEWRVGLGIGLGVDQLLGELLGGGAEGR